MKCFDGQLCLFCKNYYREDSCKTVAQCKRCEDFDMREPVDSYTEEVFQHRNDMLLIPNTPGRVWSVHKDDYEVWVYGLDALRSDFCCDMGSRFAPYPTTCKRARMVQKYLGISPAQYKKISRKISKHFSV